MAYIGNTNTTQGFIPAVDYFNGDGATVAFTLSRPVASVAQVQAVIENVPQAPGSAYTVSGQTITFDSAPPNGTGNIYVYYTSPITQVIQPGQGTVGTTQLVNGSVTNTKLDVASSDGTGAAIMPVGTTVQRPAGSDGYYRFNTTLGYPEWYSATYSSWVPFNQLVVPVVATGGAISDVRVNGVLYRVHSFTSGSSNFVVSTGGQVEYLIVAGGGGGGGGASNNNDGGGGGGAGGYLIGSTTLTSGTYPIVIGSGGTGGGNDSNGTNGSNTTALSLTANGGGYGGLPNTNGNSGGSGGGSGGGGAGGASFGGTGNQGNNGGSRLRGGSFPYNAGGGGGASSSGNDGHLVQNANGGSGILITISGTSSFFCGGGGGGAGISFGGATDSIGQGYGGSGGGGRGGQSLLGAATNGIVNTGGGGGGGANITVSRNGGNGGSGIVIIRYPI